MPLLDKTLDFEISFADRQQLAHSQKDPGMAEAERIKPILPSPFWIAVEGTRIVFHTAWHAGAFALLSAMGKMEAVKRAALLRSYLIKMGPLYMKAGQVAGTQSGFFSREVTESFRVFFSDLPRDKASTLKKTLDKAYGKEFREIFAEFRWEPIAVGSVAQVHQATLTGGKAVAVKIVKHGVRERLWASAFILKGVLRLGHTLLPGFRRYDLPGMFSELLPLLTDQCDMGLEASHQMIFEKNFRGTPFVKIPKPVIAACRSNVLVMEFMAGERGHEYEKITASRPLLARRLQEIFYTMVYFHGFFHLDPHPGNVFFGPESQVILLDFGLVGALSEEDKWQLCAFYYACSRREWDIAVRRFTVSFAARESVFEKHWSDYSREMSAVLIRHFQVKTDRWSTMSFFEDANKVMHAFGGRISTRFTLLGMAFLTGEGFISQLDPDIDIWKNARKFTERYSPYLSPDIKTRFQEHFAKAIPKSLALRASAHGYIVAPTHLDRYVLPSSFPLIVASASGSQITDIDGNRYTDISCGYGPHFLGYAHPVVVEAISRAAASGGVNAMGNIPELRLAETIASAFPSDAKVILANSGTESVLMAIRLARAFTGKGRVAKFEGHYHGFSDQGMVSSWFRFKGEKSRPMPIQGTPGSQDSVVRDTLVLQYDAPGSLERIEAEAEELACVILEPLPSAQSEFRLEFLRRLRNLCTRRGILLIFDEVVTGFRVHYGGAQHLAGVFPDLTCLGKVIGGGLPCGAVVGKGEVIHIAKTTLDPFTDIESRAFVGGTMSGNSITCSAGLAVLEYLRDRPEAYLEMESKTAWLAETMSEKARSLGVPHHIKGFRSIFTIDFDFSSSLSIREKLTGSNFRANVALAYYMRKHGVYMPELHTMMLSMAHSRQDLEKIVNAFDSSIQEMVMDGFFSS